MALTSFSQPAPPPEPLGPIPAGHRRVVFTGTYNMETLTAGLNEVRDVPADVAAGYVAAGVAAMFDDLPEPEPEVVEEMKRPYTNAPKPDWIKWAVHQGADPDAAAGMTKAELQNSYNERL
jgi:hypothetical protein